MMSDLSISDFSSLKDIREFCEEHVSKMGASMSRVTRNRETRLFEATLHAPPGQLLAERGARSHVFSGEIPHDVYLLILDELTNFFSDDETASGADGDKECRR